MTDLVFKRAFPAWQFKIEGPLAGSRDRWKRVGPKAIKRHDIYDRFLRRVALIGSRLGMPQRPCEGLDVELEVEIFWQGAQPIPAPAVAQAIAFGLWGKRSDRVTSIQVSAYEYSDRELAEVIVRKIRDERE